MKGRPSERKGSNVRLKPLEPGGEFMKEDNKPDWSLLGQAGEEKTSTSPRLVMPSPPNQNFIELETHFYFIFTFPPSSLALKRLSETKRAWAGTVNDTTL